MGVVSTKATGGGTTRTARLRWRYQSWPRRRPVSSITCERLSAAAAVAAAPARGQLTRPAHRRRAAIGMHEAPEMHGQVSHGLQLQSLWRTSKAGPKQYLSTVFANTVAKNHGIRGKYRARYSRICRGIRTCVHAAQKLIHPNTRVEVAALLQSVLVHFVRLVWNFYGTLTSDM